MRSENQNRSSRSTPRLALAGCGSLALLTLTALARPAAAQVWVDTSRADGKLPDWVDPAYVNVDVRVQVGREVPHGRIWVEPVYRTVWKRCWADPVYRTCVRRVWREPVVRVESERVWVPARYEYREVVVSDGDCCGPRIVRRERCCVEPGHWETRQREVVVRPGCFETIEERQVVTEGRYEDKPVQELVSAGRWEYR